MSDGVKNSPGRLTLHEALERLVADLETNSESGAPDYAHEALAACASRRSKKPESSEPWLADDFDRFDEVTFAVLVAAGLFAWAVVGFIIFGALS